MVLHNGRDSEDSDEVWRSEFVQRYDTDFSYVRGLAEKHFSGEHLRELDDDLKEARKVVRKYSEDLFLHPTLRPYVVFLQELRKELKKGSRQRPPLPDQGPANVDQHSGTDRKKRGPRILDFGAYKEGRRLEEVVQTPPPISATVPTPTQVATAPLLHLDIPLLQAVLLYYDSKGIIEEEKVKALQTLCLIHKLSFGVEGYPGSGKSFLVNSLLDLIDRQKLVYEVGLNSETAVFYDEAQINQRSFLYVPELQKAIGKTGSKAPPLEELIKSITEGTAGERKVNRGGRVRVQRIEPKPLIYTVAVGNAVWESYLKGNKEFRRRVIGLTTDNSYDHQEQIKRAKASQRFRKQETAVDVPVDYLRAHVTACIAMPQQVFIDPFAEYVNEHIPTTSLSGAYVQHYYNLVDACAKFHHQQRVRESNAGGANTIFITLEDHYLVHSLYFAEFIETLRAFAAPEDHAELDKALQKTIDWKACYEKGCANMLQEYPHVFESWRNAQVKEGNIQMYSPLQRRLINIISTT